MYEDVLVPTDGSPGTEEAVAQALGVTEGRLHLLSVVDRRVYLAADDDEQEAVLERLRADCEDALDAAAEAAADAEVPVETHLREGVPYREILAAGEELDADLLVLGTKGEKGREKRTDLGSTTERVVADATRPVLVVAIGSG